MRRMRFVRDCSAPGRFFPQGSIVRVIEAGESALVMPDPGGHATLCRVPRALLEPVRRFRVRLVSRTAGLVADVVHWAVDEDALRAHLDDHAPDCTVLEVRDADDD